MKEVIEDLKKSLKHKQHEILIMPLNAMREAYAKGVMAGIEVSLDKINQSQEKIKCENCKYWTMKSEDKVKRKWGSCSKIQDNIDFITDRSHIAFFGYNSLEDFSCKFWEEKE